MHAQVARPRSVVVRASAAAPETRRQARCSGSLFSSGLIRAVFRRCLAPFSLLGLRYCSPQRLLLAPI